MGFHVGVQNKSIPEKLIHTFLDECDKLLQFYRRKYDLESNIDINYDTYEIKNEKGRVLISFDKNSENIIFSLVINCSRPVDSIYQKIRSMNDVLRVDQNDYDNKHYKYTIKCSLYTFPLIYNEVFKIVYTVNSKKSKMRYGEYNKMLDVIYEILKINFKASKNKEFNNTKSQLNIESNEMSQSDIGVLKNSKIASIIADKTISNKSSGDAFFDLVVSTNKLLNDAKSIPSTSNAIIEPTNDDEIIIKSLAFNNGVETLLIQQGEMKYIKKILHIPKLVGDSGFKELKLFDRSIKQISELNIPNTPKFIESGSTDDTIWYSYEYIDGLNLNEYIQQVQLTPNMIEYFIIQLLNIQQNLIKNDIIHRDIKPSNIIVNNNELYLIDFNTIKSIGGSGGTTSILSWGYTPINETLLPNNTTDVYSIGVIWYQMITGIDVVEYAIGNKDLDLNLVKDDKTRLILSNMLCERSIRWDGKRVLDSIKDYNIKSTINTKKVWKPSTLDIINPIFGFIGLSAGIYIESNMLIWINSVLLIGNVISYILRMKSSDI